MDFAVNPRNNGRSAGQCSRNAGRPRIVLIHRYFWPDTPPYATILREIALHLAQNGMEVFVLTCQPSYNRAAVSSAESAEQIADYVTVTRWPVLSDRSSRVAKIVNLIMFGARVAVRLGKMRRVDVVMAASTPPVLIALIASVFAKMKRAAFIYHNQDIYPEVADSTGELPGYIRHWLRRIDTATDRRADRVVVLSRDMADTIAARGVDKRAIAVINNFDPWTLADQCGSRPATSDVGTIRLVYAGNLGRFQNLQVLASGIAALRNDERFRFDFIGDGPMRTWLEQFTAGQGLSQVRFLGYMAPDDLAARLNSLYDIGILSLHPEVIRYAYPSKMMSYLRNGLPVLSLVEQDSELGDLLGRYQAGWSADGDPGAFSRALDTIWKARGTLPMMRAEARRMYETEFERTGQLSKWSELFNSFATRGQ